MYNFERFQPSRWFGQNTGLQPGNCGSGRCFFLLKGFTALPKVSQISNASSEFHLEEFCSSLAVISGKDFL
jgi:hypothetical protein